MIDTRTENEVRSLLARQAEALIPPSLEARDVMGPRPQTIEVIGRPDPGRRLLAIAAGVLLVLVGGGVTLRATQVPDETTTAVPEPSTPLPVPTDRRASTGDLVDASRLLSDGVPEGFVLSVAADNADLDREEGSYSQALYVDRSGEPVISVWVDPEDPIHVDEEHFDILPFDNPTTIDVDGTEVLIHGTDLRLAVFTIDDIYFTVHGPWPWGADHNGLKDDDLVSVARAILDNADPSALPDEVLEFTLLSIEELANYEVADGAWWVSGPSDGSTTVYTEFEITAPAGAGRFLEISTSPVVEGEMTHFEAWMASRGDPVDLGAVPGLTDRSDVVLTSGEDSASPTLTMVFDDEIGSISFRVGDRLVAIHGMGLDEAELIEVASTLRTASDDEWGVGLD